MAKSSVYNETSRFEMVTSTNHQPLEVHYAEPLVRAVGSDLFSRAHRSRISVLLEVVPLTIRRDDPRPAQSRALLVDAATALLRSGGPSAVTIDAVTSAANVARATLYRHFASGDDLLAAAFYSLVPRAPMPSQGGTLRDRLIALVQACAESFAGASVTLTAISWPTVGANTQVLAGASGAASSRDLHTLRERVAQQWAEPFDVIFSSPEAKAELGYVDRSQAVALLLGPIVLGTLNLLDEFDYRACTRAAVDGFLATHAEKAKKRSAPDGG